MNPLTWSYRTLCLFGAIFCFSSIGYALYVQYHMLMMPCPLCIFQRVAIGAAVLTETVLSSDLRLAMT